MRESQILSKKEFPGSLKTTLTDVLQNNLDSALDISRITLQSNQVLIDKFKVYFLDFFWGFFFLKSKIFVFGFYSMFFLFFLIFS